MGFSCSHLAYISCSLGFGHAECAQGMWVFQTTAASSTHRCLLCAGHCTKRFASVSSRLPNKHPLARVRTSHVTDQEAGQGRVSGQLKVIQLGNGRARIPKRNICFQALCTVPWPMPPHLLPSQAKGLGHSGSCLVLGLIFRASGPILGGGWMGSVHSGAGRAFFLCKGE